MLIFDRVAYLLCYNITHEKLKPCKMFLVCIISEYKYLHNVEKNNY